MVDFKENIILFSASIVEAMQKLNQVPETLTLFVLNQKNQIIGTLTDGDIRRGFINGLSLSDDVQRFMNKQFSVVTKKFDVFDFKNAKNKGIRLLPVIDENCQILKVYDLKKQKSILPVEAVIMAGGRGERLRPLTDTIPKPMLPLADKPIIEHNIDRLISYGIQKIYISIRYLGQKIIDYFGNGKSKGISIEYIWEEEPLGTAGALSLINNFKTEYILIMNGDLFTNIDFEDLYLNTIYKKASVGIASITYTAKVPYGIFKTNGSNIVSGLIEKPVYTEYANAGIYILNKNVLSKIPYKQFYNMTDLLEQLIKENEIIIHNPIIGYWIDIGQYENYKNAIEISKHTKNAD